MQTSITEELRNHGYKVTPQRLAIYDALVSTKTHPNADMLFAQLQPKYPSMSLATIYKTVDMLEKIGRLKVLSTGEDSFRYDADITVHDHIQCIKCGRVDDVFDVSDTNQLKRLEEQTGYRIKEQRVYLYGECAKCKNK